MKKSAHWAPAPNLTIMTVERHEADWAVSVSGGDHAACPLCGVRSHSRHSSYRRTVRDLPAQEHLSKFEPGSHAGDVETSNASGASLPSAFQGLRRRLRAEPPVSPALSDSSVVALGDAR